MNLIEIKKLSYSYPTLKDALKNISLKIREGEFTCIVGENGSGKSTLIKCIVGLINDYEGEITVQNRVRIFTTKNRNTEQFPCFYRRNSIKWHNCK